MVKSASDWDNPDSPGAGLFQRRGAACPPACSSGSTARGHSYGLALDAYLPISGRAMTKVIKSLDYLLALAAQKEERRLERSTVRDFVEAVCTGNAELLKKCVEAREDNFQWRAAMEAVAKSSGAPNQFREGLLGPMGLQRRPYSWRG